MGFFKNLFQSKKQKQQAQKYRIGMAKARDHVFSELADMLQANRLDEAFFEALEELFIFADMGVDTSLALVETLREKLPKVDLEDAEALKEAIVETLFDHYVKSEIVDTNLNVKASPSVLLFVGVNGVGKTTTIGKVAKQLRDQGKTVMLVAGDTFRAGAINQLKIWAERTNSEFYAKSEGSDPSSVMFEAIKKAREASIDVLLCDTAGRLQNKKNLMEELAKMRRVIEREVEGAPHETLLVLDATTGQNGLSQARIFDEVTDLSGLILTKLDGSAKGGIALAIKDQFDIPIKMVGLGEKVEDLMYFDIEDYIYALLADVF